MQTVKNFVFGRDRSGSINTTTIEDQINEYLEYHPGYSVATMSLLNASGYKEAFVVFDIRDDRGEKESHRLNKQDNKNHDKEKV